MCKTNAINTGIDLAIRRATTWSVIYSILDFRIPAEHWTFVLRANEMIE